MRITIRKRMIGTIPLLEVVQHELRYQALPLVVYYHGWQSQKELNLTQARHLARAGIRVVLPDAVNHGERKQPVSKIPSLTFWQSIHSNLMEFGAIVEHFRKINVVTSIGVGGISMGGMTTCALLTHHPEIEVAACVMGTPKLVAYRERIQRHATRMGRFFPADYQDLLNWIPKYDLSENIETLADRPFFIWHGREDEIVPYHDVVDFVAEHPLPNITFDEGEEAHLVTVATMEKVAAFFANHLA